MYNCWFSPFEGYVTDINKELYNDIKSLTLLLEGTSRLSYQNIYLLDFHNGDVLYSSRRQVCEVDANIKYPTVLCNNYNNVDPQERDNSIRIIKSWYEFLEKRPIDTRLNFTLEFDINISNRLLCVNITPIFLSNDGKPWIMLCLSNTSTNSTSGNATILHKNSQEVWTYSAVTQRWKRSSLMTLTEIEQNVLRLSIQGKTESEISEEIFRSKDGLKSLKRRLFRKMKVNNITEAVSFAISHGLI